MTETFLPPKILESLFIGISIAAIPGPIFFELIRRTLTKGFFNGLSLVMGEFSGNFLLLLLIFFGVSHILTTSMAKSILFVVGGMILCKIGIDALKLKQNIVERSYNELIKAKTSFFTGFSIAVTSPIVIALWISFSGSYLSVFQNRYLAFFHIFLIAFGVLVFFVPLAAFVHISRHKISPKHVVLLSKIFGMILIGYGMVLFYQVIKLL